MVKRRGSLNPSLRIKTPYTRFASDFWACYKIHGHQKAVISKPRLDQTERKILFEFFEDVKEVTNPKPDIVCDSSVRSSLFDFCKETKSAPTSSFNPDTPNVYLLPTVGSPCTEKAEFGKLTLTSPTLEQTGSSSVQSPVENLSEDDVEVIPDPGLNVPPSNQTVDVMTSLSLNPREYQGRVIGFMSRIISEKWKAADNDLKDEYRRQTAEERSTYLETMIAIHLRHGFPLPSVRIEETRCMNALFQSIYKWYKQNPDILETGYPGKDSSDPVLSHLRSRCFKFRKAEMQRFKTQCFTSKSIIKLDLTNSQLDNRDEEMTDCSDHTPGTNLTPNSPQYSDQASNLSGNSEGHVSSSSPERSTPDSLPRTPNFKMQRVAGPSGQSSRIYHTTLPSYSPSSRVFNSRPNSASPLQPLSPPLTPVLSAKFPGSVFLRPPPPQPPSMLYSLYGVSQGSQQSNNCEKGSASISNWISSYPGTLDPNCIGPIGSVYSVLYPGYQWNAELPSLTPYPLSTPALQETTEMYAPPAPPCSLSPSPGLGSPVQGNDLYLTQQQQQQHNYFNNTPTSSFNPTI